MIVAFPGRSRDKAQLDGQGSNFPRLQVETAGPNSERPCTARTVCDDGLPGSFGGTYAANHGRGLEYVHSAWRIRARQMELDRVRCAPSDHDQHGHSLCHQMVEARYDMARRDI